MLTQEQLERLRTLVQLYVEELPLPAAVDALLLLYDVCELLELSGDHLERIFGSAPLRLVTGYAYGEGPRPGPVKTRVGVPIVGTVEADGRVVWKNGVGAG